MVTVAGPTRSDVFESGLDASAAGERPGEQVLRGLGVGQDGLPAGEAARRLARYGPNAVVTHRARLLLVLWHQLRSPLLGLLLAAAAASYFVRERSDAVIIAVIVALSVGLGFVNEYRAEKAAEALHSQIHHRALAVRGGHPVAVDVTALVPGDIVELRLGDVVPADIRLLQVSGLECDESVLTGESLPVEKDTAPVPAGTPLAELAGCALMGTVVHAGSGRGVVTATGARTEFGRIAAGLGAHQTETQFQVGLRRFSMLLVYVAAALTTSIFVINVVLHRPILDALLFSLAIAVGITPQLLPAVVSMSLAAGSRQMARRKVLVKRLVCIEDLGDIDTLFTDKTGTLTQGRISFMRAVTTDPAAPDAPLRWGLTCTEATIADGHAVGGNPLDLALWDSPAALGQRAALAGDTRLSVLPFDYERRLVSVLVRDRHGTQTIVTKGAPEAVLQRCRDVPASATAALAAEFAAGNRVVAVATRPAPDLTRLTPADEHDLRLAGLLVFLDPPKPDAAAALARLAGLGITVKIVTGDNPAVAAKVCHDLGLPAGAVLTGTDIDALDDTRLAAAIPTTTVFARVSPEHKARIVRLHRLTGADVAFLGDGVNDALALHAADVGISVDSATDVAKVDAEQLRRPSHWDIRFIRRFMLYFGPFSSVFDFATFAVMLWVFHSGPAQFRTGWFVESLATQTLVIFAIRTRRIPFLRSHPSLPLTLAALGVVTAGALLPATPLAHTLGFQPLPGGFFAALALMVACYLALIEVGKRLFYGAAPTPTGVPALPVGRRHLRRRAAYFSTHHGRRLRGA